MKVRNFIIVLLAVLMAFAFASCKHEPKEEPKPTPQPKGDIYQIEVTEGVDKDYYNRDKIKLVWNVPIQEGDTLSLKYRSERAVYQWDIRNDSHKWVYETDKNGFVDPVLGEDGWYTLEYTFGKTITGAAGASTAFGVYFRGNFVTTDIFEIKDILLNGEELEVEAGNITSRAQLNDPAEDFDWSVKNYAVLFATGKPGAVDKTPIAEKVVAGGKVTGAPISKDGFTLTIYTDEAHTSIFDPNEPINEEKIFYYEYVGVPRTVTFVTNSDSVIAPVTVPNSDSLKYAHTYDEAGHYALDGEGNKIIVDLVPENPVKTDMAFAAWCTDAELTTDFDVTTAITADTTLYAKYGTPRTITFDAKNGEAEHATQVVADGYAATMPAEAPTYEEYMFLGWFTDEEYTTAYAFGTPVTADITLYAKWGVPVNVTLNLNYEGAPAATVFQTPYSVALAETDENLKVEDNRIAFFFDGWYTDAECTTPYNYTALVTEAFTLYAKWRPGKVAQIVSTYNYKENTGNYDKYRIKFTDGDYKTVVKGGDVLTFRYRSTTPITKFNVRGDKKWIYQQNFATPYVTSYEVGTDGWTYVTYTFPLADGTNAFDDGQGKIPTDFYDTDRTFYFDFIAYTIVKGDILEVQGMALNGKELTIDAGNIQSGTSSTKPDYNAEVTTAYEWAKQAVTYNTGVADAIDPAEVVFGGRAVKPADPVKAGYHFVGWYADAEFTKEFDFENTVITKATTIYAKLGVAKTVSFEPNGGSAVAAIEVAEGDKVAKPANPTKADVVFAGWFTDSELTTAYNFDTPVTADITLYARWIAPAKLTLNLNYGGAPDATVLDVEPSVAITAPKNPSRVGYYFGGWYKEAGCTTAFDFAEGITADTTIYAKWDAPTKSYKFTVKDGGETDDRFQWIWKASALAELGSPLKAGDVLTFMIKTTPSTGQKITNFRLRNGNEKDIGLKYVDLPAAGGDGWIAATIVLPEDSSVGGFILGLYAAGHPGGAIKAGDVLEIKAVAFNGKEITIGALDGYSAAADMEEITL